MEIKLKNNSILIDKRKARLTFDIEKWIITITNLDTKESREINKPGEYEISNILVYVKRFSDKIAFSMTIEWKTIVILNSTDIIIDKELTDFVWNLDILLLPAWKWANTIIEWLEPRIVLPFWDMVEDFYSRISKTPDFIKKYKSKESDFQSESTLFLALINETK